MDLEKVKKGEIKILRGVDLRKADLTGANLRCADLTGANLRCADLTGVDLREANLTNADLKWTNLRRADLTGGNLTRANLRGANLSRADLTGVDLRDVNLSGSDLRYANLSRADLRHVDLRGVDLRNADLMNVKTNYLTMGYNMACPEEGSFIAYKKVNDCLVKLLILEDSKRSSATTLKCRCDKAKVLDIEDIDTGEKLNKVRSEFDEDFIYIVGEIVKVDDFDEDRWNECSTGIHFFMNKENAINY